jgi:hypothetical protein
MDLCRISLSLCLVGASAGCKQSTERAAPANAEARSKTAAPRTAAPDAPPAQSAPAKAETDSTRTLAKTNPLGAAGGTIEWQQLVPFLPDRIGTFEAEGEVRGMTQDLGNGAKATMARRDYRAGERSMRIAVGDSFLNATASVGLKHNVKLDHQDDAGFAKTSKLGDYAVLLTWQKAQAVSQCIVLLGDRLLEVAIKNARMPTEAETIAKQMRLAPIAELRARTAD